MNKEKMTHYTAIISSFVVGVAAALLLRGRFRWLLAGAQMGLGAGLRDMKMVMVVRSDLEIGRNKAASQCSHAAINCYKRALSDAPQVLRKWERQGQTKVVLKILGESDLLKLAQTAHAAGLVAVVIHDSVAGHDTPTVLGIGPGPASLVDQVAGHLKLF